MDNLTPRCREHNECGCEYGGECCFDCVRSECVLIEWSGSHSVRARSERVRELRGLGLPVAEVARRMGCSTRAVSRLAKEPRKGAPVLTR